METMLGRRSQQPHAADSRWLYNFLARVPIFANLPATEIVSVASKMRERVFRKGEVIFHKGDAGQVMYIIRSGQVRIFMVTEEEQEVSVAILSAGDFFGEFALLDDKPRSASAICMERTLALTLHRDDFLAHLREHPDLAIGIMSLLTARLRQANEQIENLTFLDVYGRVAKKLLDLAETHGVRTPTGIAINLRLTQRDLASLVGTTRESVNRVLSAYQNRGVIELEHQHVTILKPTELRKRIY
jgi:CRP-like cAMP-binding protein